MLQREVIGYGLRIGSALLFFASFLLSATQARAALLLTASGCAVVKATNQNGHRGRCKVIHVQV